MQGERTRRSWTSGHVEHNSQVLRGCRLCVGPRARFACAWCARLCGRPGAGAPRVLLARTKAQKHQAGLPAAVLRMLTSVSFGDMCAELRFACARRQSSATRWASASARPCPSCAGTGKRASPCGASDVQFAACGQRPCLALVAVKARAFVLQSPVLCLQSPLLACTRVLDGGQRLMAWSHAQCVRAAARRGNGQWWGEVCECEVRNCVRVWAERGNVCF